MTFVISELGINHNGNLDIAKQLIDASKWAGADAIKLQKRDVNIVYAGQLDKPRESPWGKTNGDQKRGLEFNELQYDLIASYCESIKMPWFASAWDIPSLEFLRKYDCPWNKVASAMVKNIEFLAAVSWEHKPTFISTAMCDYDDIDRAVKIFSRNISSSSLTLMHCVGTYPCREEDLNLNMIPTLAKRYIYPIGYSGHEASVSPSVMAVVLGATAVERHITLDRSMYGSDQAASLEPHGFKSMVDQIRKVPDVLGSGVKTILPAELEVAKKLRYWEV
jgi:N-acetylneuraminate synthase